MSNHIKEIKEYIMSSWKSLHLFKEDLDEIGYTSRPKLEKFQTEVSPIVIISENERDEDDCYFFDIIYLSKYSIHLKLGYYYSSYDGYDSLSFSLNQVEPMEVIVTRWEISE